MGEVLVYLHQNIRDIMECEYSISYNAYTRSQNRHLPIDIPDCDSSIICNHPDAPFMMVGSFKDNYICWFAKAIHKCPLEKK